MGKIAREDYYFDAAGEQNTDDVIEAVVKRVESTGIRHVVVATSSGLTGAKFAQALQNKTQVICVSSGSYRREWGLDWPCLNQEYKRELEELGAISVDKTSYIFEGAILEGAERLTYSPEFLVRQTLYCFGHGFKVAVEVVLIAVDLGHLEPYQDVIGVGGRTKGADTAVILRATYPAMIFSKNHEKRLEIREIIAMPRLKK